MQQLTLDGGALELVRAPCRTRAVRVKIARSLGAESGERARFRAEASDPTFGERALNFIRDYADAARKAGRAFAGEDCTNAAKAAGIRPHDDRAFGPVYAKAIRTSVIRVVGYVPRVKGHGSAGGKLYARVVQ